MGSKNRSDISQGRAAAYILLSLVGVVAVLVYLNHDPTHNELFPKCPVYLATGLKCPGCGSQRAIHYLLCGDLAAAWRMNQLLIVSIPNIILGVAAQILQRRSATALWIRRKLYGVTAAWVVLALIVCFTVLRNVLLGGGPTL